MASTNRRMHKGFPEMLTYLLRKPMEYCSHQFVHVIVDLPLRDALGVLFAGPRCSVLEGSKRFSTPGMRLHASPSLKVKDYPFRPKQLELFPLYFFMSACETRLRLNADSMDWGRWLRFITPQTEHVTNY